MAAPPTALVEAIDALNQYRRQYEQSFVDGRWQGLSHADMDMLAFCRLALANVVAVENLGRADLHFVVPATAAARAAYEAVITGAWMVAPDDLVERDRRWGSIFVDEQAHWQGLAEKAIQDRQPQDRIDAFLTEARRVGRILKSVKPHFGAQGYPQPERVPDMDERLRELKRSRHLVVYKIACEFVHPATRALSTVRDLAAHRNEVTEMTFEWRTRPRHWATAILLAAEAMAFGMETIATRLNPRHALDPSHVELFNAVTAKVETLPA